MDFDIAVNQGEGEQPVIELKGEVSVYTAPQLKEQMSDFQRHGTVRYVVDLTKVDYVDSTALGVLILGLKQAKENEGDVVLVCPTQRMLRVFQRTGLDKIFTIVDSVKDAQAAIGTAATTA